MKHLPIVAPTAEQLPLISSNKMGFEVIRGAAGSGKTSTAILRLHSLAHMFEARRKREGSKEPVKILVLTFNKTLRGYVHEMVNGSTFANSTTVEIETYAKWAMDAVDHPEIVRDQPREQKIRTLASGIDSLSPSFVIREVDYLLGRFPVDELQRYLTTERTGRGTTPRVDRNLRLRLLKEVVEPYQQWLLSINQWDWNDLAIAMARATDHTKYDIIIIDETQDFSANQLRSLHSHLATPYAATFVIDSVQRIYARGFTWTEAGVDIQPQRFHTLQENHRNTAEIAAFAAGILADVPTDNDGTMPDLAATSRSGAMPIVLKGKYNQQMDWAIKFIKSKVRLASESVSFLSPGGGRWLDFAKSQLAAAGLPCVDITRQGEWPDGEENIAFSTFHSAKGLEFDHVFILGLSNENTAHGEDALDDQLTTLRRLLALAVARARQTVCVGYKPGEESDLVGYFAAGTFEGVDL
jgi:superfamily I DNA/RNA helicase